MTRFSISEDIGADAWDAPVFFYCDHASNAIPSEFDDLGLSEDMLATHIALDVGAGALTRALATRIGAPGFLSGFSRLLIDPNRSLDRDDLIPACADGLPVPGNQNLTGEERHRRICEFFEPYHERLGYQVERVCGEKTDPLFISIHSFTRRLNTDAQDRPWEVGVLWRKDEATARTFMASLSQTTDLQVGDNQPYSALEFNYSVDRHVGSRAARHLTLEIRQDLISDDGGVAAVADLLIRPIEALMSSTA